MIRSAGARVTPRVRDGFWDQPLGYAHAFVTVVMALTLGLAFHAWVGYRMLVTVPPLWLGVAGAAPLIVLAVAARLGRGDRFIRWITGIPFAMMSTGAVGLFAVAGGVVPERIWAEQFGLSSVWGSWPFLFAGYLMMLNLIGSCGRRCWPMTYANIVYLTSHLGLGLALCGGAMSSIVLERHTMVLFKGVPTQKMTDRENREWKAPFAATLREFRMETFPPTAMYAKADDRSQDGIDQTPGEQFLKAGMKEKIGPVKLEVLEHFAHAAYDGLHWRAVAWKTAAPASKVRATLADGTAKEGWISSGSPETMPAYLMLGDKEAIFMSAPRPRKFESSLDVDGQKIDVAVNRPAHVKGWDVFQFSYDEKMGAASGYSVIELVRDKGLPVVYTGIFAMLIGAVLHLWNGVGGKK